MYLTWIPLAYIFNTNLLDILLGLFPRPEFRNLALQCLTEVGSLPEVGTDHNDKFVLLFQHFMNALVGILPQDIDVALVRLLLKHLLKVYVTLCPGCVTHLFRLPYHCVSKL